MLNIKNYNLNKEKHIDKFITPKKFVTHKSWRMKNKQNTEHQIIKVLKDYSSGESGLELFKKYGVYGSNIFELKQKYTDSGIDILKELIDLNEENCRLQIMYADLSIQYRKVKELLKEDF